jgi:hypothetical protein
MNELSRRRPQHVHLRRAPSISPPKQDPTFPAPRLRAADGIRVSATHRVPGCAAREASS